MTSKWRSLYCGSLVRQSRILEKQNRSHKLEGRLLAAPGCTVKAHLAGFGKYTGRGRISESAASGPWERYLPRAAKTNSRGDGRIPRIGLELRAFELTDIFGTKLENRTHVEIEI